MYGYVISAIYKWRKKTGARGPITINPIEDRTQRIRYPSAECRWAGELYLLELAQKGMGISWAKMLASNVVTEENVLGQRRKLITAGLRAKNQIAGVYGRAQLPVLQRVHPLAVLYMWAAHEKGHEGILSTFHRSRRSVWIIYGRPLAETIWMSCTECRLKEKKCMVQRMGPLPDHRVGPSPIFHSVAGGGPV
jgi:hypothetical protein